MISRQELLEYLKKNSEIEFSKEEIINRFSKSEVEEDIIYNLLSEIEVESTFIQSNLIVNCKGGTVYYKWHKSL